MSSRRAFSAASILLTKKADRKLPTLILYTGNDCQLCDVAKATLDDMRKGGIVSFHLEEYNIRDDSLKDVEKWRRSYQYDIPVLHLNGKEIARHRLNREQVEAHIREANSDY